MNKMKKRAMMEYNSMRKRLVELKKDSLDIYSIYGIERRIEDFIAIKETARTYFYEFGITDMDMFRNMIDDVDIDIENLRKYLYDRYRQEFGDKFYVISYINKDGEDVILYGFLEEKNDEYYSFNIMTFMKDLNKISFVPQKFKITEVTISPINYHVV